jgi:uncharacterized OB-fold protein
VTGGSLRAPHAVAFTYERSVGGAVERFLRGLARAELWGSRMADGRVVVPPADHDPATGAAAAGFVRVGDAGTVRSWTWVAGPGPGHPLDHPFAFALVGLDGADTALLHVVDPGPGGPAAMATGMRVRADWRDERTGGVRDIRAFVPEGPAPDPPAPGPGAPDDLTVRTEVRLSFGFEPGVVVSRFYRALAAGRIEGGRCGGCGAVYVPPRGRCPSCGGDAATATVDLPGTGAVESVAVVHLPVAGMDLDLPFAWAWIRLDGADVPFAHLLGGVAPDEVRVGRRVAAVWAPPGDRPAGWEAIHHFRPEGGRP